ncbi:MAG: hypothetical protein ACTHMS_16715 [Jatrophihabitans sp.]|uniref:hypothetical protein n=1 Tax=Jatrophihabitans sp. TaxID=1932789 RepID=UPI003F7D1850
MNVSLLWHVHHADSARCVTHFGDAVLIDEQDGDDVKLLGCYSTLARAHDRVLGARTLSGFADEPNCFIVDTYEVDHDEWLEGFVST